MDCLRVILKKIVILMQLCDCDVTASIRNDGLYFVIGALSVNQTFLAVFLRKRQYC